MVVVDVVLVRLGINDFLTMMTFDLFRMFRLQWKTYKKCTKKTDIFQKKNYVNFIVFDQGRSFISC